MARWTSVGSSAASRSASTIAQVRSGRSSSPTRHPSGVRRTTASWPGTGSAPEKATAVVSGLDRLTPGARAPDGSEPEPRAPGARAPDGSGPEPRAPGARAPDGLAPDGLAPDGLAPDGSRADVLVPGAAEADAPPENSLQPGPASVAESSTRDWVLCRFRDIRARPIRAAVPSPSRPTGS